MVFIYQGRARSSARLPFDAPVAKRGLSRDAFFSRIATLYGFLLTRKMHTRVLVVDVGWIV